ncbi:MAG: hydroxyethylthiazole kinase [Pseudomonadota bacterium]
MLISPPFLLPRAADESDDQWINRCMVGGEPSQGAFPLSFNLGWHGGMHLIAPMNGAQPEPVRAIADGTVVFIRAATPQPAGPLNEQTTPLAYRGRWTDNGVVVIRHETEIGDGANSQVMFFSIYMHLSEVDNALQLNRPVFRKARIGAAGQVYGDVRRQIHFEIVCDDANLRRFTGRLGGDLPINADGRLDAVYGQMYFLLPGGTRFYGQKPLDHLAEAHRQPPKPSANAPLPPPQALQAVYTSGQTEPLVVALRYAGSEGALADRGDAQLSTLRLDGTSLGAALRENEAEYQLYRRAVEVAEAHPMNARPAPSAVYELLRFGRVVNTNNETLTPATVPHWRQVRYPGGQGWVNLNAANVCKFSDADFPHWQQWRLIDDSADQDCRCDSATLRSWLDMSGDGQVDPVEAAARLSDPSLSAKLARTICKVPTEWDAATIDQRWGWLKTSTPENPNPFTEADFALLRSHIQALAFFPGNTGLPPSHWHFQPREFVRQFRGCGWLSLEELMRAIPAATEQNARRFRHSINLTLGKYMGAGRVRHSHFLGQVAHETGSLAGPMVERGNSPGSRAYESDASYFAGPDTYSYFRLAQGYERLNNTLGNQYNSGDGIKFRGRGSLQVTGRAHYATYWVYRGWLNSGDFHHSWWSRQGWWQSPPNPDIRPALINQPQRVSARAQGNEFNPVDVGGWFWVSKLLNRTCDPEDRGTVAAPTSDAVSMVINRYDEETFPARRARVERAKQALGDGTT